MRKSYPIQSHIELRQGKTGHQRGREKVMLTQMRVSPRKPKIIKGRQDCQGKGIKRHDTRGYYRCFPYISNKSFKHLVDNSRQQSNGKHGKKCRR